MTPLRHLDLFSGIGGFALGLRWTGGFETIGFCEIDPYCQAVLRKHWPDVPIHDDIRTLDGSTVGPVDVVTGGFPCQPFSHAGQRRGANDDRHLWPEMVRVVRELRPRWVVGENVVGLVSLGLDDVLSDLEANGYACQTFDIPAVAVDAKHRRHRLWIVAHDYSGGLPKQGVCPELAGRAKTVGASQDAADCDGRGAEWLPEPDVGRVAHGVPNRVDRLRALGNAVVPQIPQILGEAILAAEGR